MIPKKNLIIISVLLILGLIVLAFILLTQTQKGADLTSEVQKLREQQAVFASGEDVFAYKGKTFVKYDHEPVNAIIYTSNTCPTCGDAIASLTDKIKTSVPTIKEIVVRDTDIADFKSEALASNVAYVPGVVFSPEIVNTPLYTAAPEFFKGIENGSYQFSLHAFGHSAEKYIASPKNMDGFIVPGVPADAQGNVPTPILEVHAFLTADCGSCKTAYNTLDSLAKSNPTVKFVRHYSRDRQESESLVTQAMACASSLGKGEVYANNIYLRQAAWKAIAPEGLRAVLERYAANYTLDTVAFAGCLDTENADIAKQEVLFSTFGITEVPTIFVGEQPFVGVQTVPTLQKAITDQTAPVRNQVTTTP